MRARLRGPSMVRYYPEQLDLSKAARQNPLLEIQNEDEVQRFADVELLRKRGKGPPKKTRKGAASGRSKRDKARAPTPSS